MIPIFRDSDAKRAAALLIFMWIGGAFLTACGGPQPVVNPPGEIHLVEVPDDEAIQPASQGTFVEDDDAYNDPQNRQRATETPPPGPPVEGSGLSGAALGQCVGIADASMYWEVCEVGVGFCAGTFKNGKSCDEYCAAADLACAGAWSGEQGCVKGAVSVGCAGSNEYQTAWCECLPGAEVCIAACEGKVCGDDGCGGQCGECAEGNICEEGGCAHVSGGSMVNGPKSDSECGDDECEGPETSVTCEEDCGSLCGDGSCNGMETTSNCVADCSEALKPDPTADVLGHIDGTTVSDGEGYISGWACHSGWAGSVDVHLYAGGSEGEGVFIKSSKAAESNEPAVGDACQTQEGAHRFQINLFEEEINEYQGMAIYIHGISPVGNENHLLANSGDLIIPGGIDEPGPLEPDSEPEPETIPDPVSEDDLPPDLSDVIWLHTDVSGWAQTATLSNTYFQGGVICMPYDKASVWPIDTVGAEKVEIVANPWIFIQEGGQWYAGTWEWLRPEQICKASSSVAGDHIKQPPFDASSGWKPTSGKVYWFMVSAPARMGQMTVAERSNLVKVVWP